MATIKNIVGNVYGKLTVISYQGKVKHGKTTWLCKCECGNEKIIYGGNLISCKTKSCGCLRKEFPKIFIKHGQSSYNLTAEYSAWAGLKDRCYNSNNRAYKNYGGRGIKVCDRWLHSFENFITDMGKKPSTKHSLDRFPNKNGNYEIKNCRWATEYQQQSNRRNNRWIEYEGTRMIFQDWARKFEVTHAALAKHLKTKTFHEVIEYYKNKAYA